MSQPNQGAEGKTRRDACNGTVRAGRYPRLRPTRFEFLRLRPSWVTSRCFSGWQRRRLSRLCEPSAPVIDAIS